MNYVENFNFYGTKAQQIPCIKGAGAPTTETAGEVGCLYMDTLNGDTYKCIAVTSAGTYTWIPNTPLHYNYIVTLGVAFDDLFMKDNIEGNPYTNSFRTTDFSRTPQVGDIFSLIFIDKHQNNVYSFCEITSPPVQNPDGIWFSPFKVVYAIMLHNTGEIAELKETVDGIEAEDWTFLVEVKNEDGTISTEPKMKKVCVIK